MRRTSIKTISQIRRNMVSEPCVDGHWNFHESDLKITQNPKDCRTPDVIQISNKGRYPTAFASSGRRILVKPNAKSLAHATGGMQCEVLKVRLPGRRGPWFFARLPNIKLRIRTSAAAAVAARCDNDPRASGKSTSNLEVVAVKGLMEYTQVFTEVELTEIKTAGDILFRCFSEGWAV